MTEAEWVACTDPVKILEFLQGKTSDRKLRLFAVACCRRVWGLLVNFHSREVLFCSERYADGQDTKEQMKQYRRKAMTVARGKRKRDVKKWAAEAATAAASVDIYAYFSYILYKLRDAQGETNTTRESTIQAGLLLDLLGNPFRPAPLDPDWLTWKDGTIPRLAQAIYEDRELPSGHLDQDRLAVLGDALEDAGCSDPDILGHCRGPGPHVRGCWLIDLLLGKG
jgi:hypothetical protein